MKILGIIGGIGSGKSTACELLRQSGAAVINADEIGHQVLQLPDVKDTAQKRWGNAVFGEDGEIDRRKLAAIVFANENELIHLNALTHPLIAEEIEQQREKHEQSGVQLCVLDAPLLLEAGWEHLVDQIVFVDAPAEERWNRVKSRGWTEAEWQRREAAQLSVEEKTYWADIILDNSGDTEHLREQVKTLFPILW